MRGAGGREAGSSITKLGNKCLTRWGTRRAPSEPFNCPEQLTTINIHCHSLPRLRRAGRAGRRRTSGDHLIQRRGSELNARAKRFKIHNMTHNQHADNRDAAVTRYVMKTSCLGPLSLPAPLDCNHQQKEKVGVLQDLNVKEEYVERLKDSSGKIKENESVEP
ncbi:hypothetical protein EVAR_9076_1 [Eumeta japonica]|uniref:Uncharacterized protein n=1 Tax=Eumeta variegata TaxID=151549 RepID=A0A4C1TWH6_EUMVA|nr:hypothetical protein EVAR_9076_1 [Eumeta japonica]